MIGDLAAAHGPAERAHVWAKADHDLGLDFWRDLGLIATLAGPDQVLVNELSIRDHDGDREVVLAREGAIQDPKAEIEAILAAP